MTLAFLPEVGSSWRGNREDERDLLGRQHHVDWVKGCSCPEGRPGGDTWKCRIGRDPWSIPPQPILK
jgi:hypothetical protein